MRAKLFVVGILVGIVLAMLSCTEKGEPVPNSGAIKVEKIGDVDGCGVYRFRDGIDRTIYVTRCPTSVAMVIYR